MIQHYPTIKNTSVKQANPISVHKKNPNIR